MEITRTVGEWNVGESRIRWSAVFAGFVVGVSVQMVLTLLGLAIGAWSINLHESQPTQGIPLGTGIWTGLSMLISAFTGGYVTSRLSGASLRSDGMYHAAVVWGVTWLVFTWLTTTAMATMIGGLFSAFGSGLQSIGQAAGQGISTTVSKVVDKTTPNTNVSGEGLKKQIESILQATQKPELQPGEMKKDAGKVTDKAQGGQSISQVTDSGLAELKEKLTALDKEAAINVMVNKFGMSKTQAQEVVQSSIGMIEPLKGKAQEVKEQSVDVANTTIKNLASVAWWMFVLAMLSLGATLGGGALGICQELRMEIEGRPSLRPAHAGV
ncbi:MAG: conserved rane protein of unknown function [Nitrospira sp.]|nr:conserved rane protein of unknown function [Nitrospira sp.]MCE3222512.1 conserved rane protein of unknown function [Nitrospira sp.]